MRSLTFKLTLAFLLVAIVGVVVFAVLVGGQTQGEFSRFLSARDQNVLITALSEHYQVNGSWAGLRERINSSPQLTAFSRGAIIADANSVIVFGRESDIGQHLPNGDKDDDTIIEVDGRAVGYVRFAPIDRPSGGNFGRNNRPPPNESAFVGRVGQAALISAGVAAGTALLIGLVLARTLTKPVRELTEATRALAQGNLDQRVTVHSEDELGALAQSFNQMSSDLARSTSARKQMTADLAHDLRTPLSILRGYTEGLKEGRVQGSPKLYDIMFGEVAHLQRMVEDLRTLSLADAGEIRLNKRAVDPKALLERTALAYVMQAEQQGVTLKVDAPDDLPSIHVDTDRIAQVLNNLVTNALRHTTKGSITLSAAAENKAVVLKVCDTGTGIAPEDVPFVFDRLYRADKSRQRVRDERTESDASTSGLGLAIAKAIVEAHGGTISVTSTVGQGTTFAMRLG
jgi:two-component system sensor histidine kinase BaeS